MSNVMRVFFYLSLVSSMLFGIPLYYCGKDIEKDCRYAIQSNARSSVILFDGSSVATVICDQNGIVLATNLKAKKLFGELKDQPITSLVSSADKLILEGKIEELSIIVSAKRSLWSTAVQENFDLISKHGLMKNVTINIRAIQYGNEIEMILMLESDNGPVVSGR